MNQWFNLHLAPEGESTLFVRDQIHSGGIDELLEKLAKVQRLVVHLDTVGGDSKSAWRLYRLLSEKEHVTAVVDSRCWSAGMAILAAAGSVKMERKGSLFLHPSQGVAVGDATELRAFADQLDRDSRCHEDVLSLRRKIPIEQLRDLHAKSTWIDSAKALELGLVDSVFDSPANAVEWSPPDRKPGADVQSDDGSESLALDLLRHLRVRTRDRAAFAREVNVWFTRNVTEQ